MVLFYPAADMHNLFFMLIRGAACWIFSTLRKLPGPPAMTATLLCTHIIQHCDSFQHYSSPPCATIVDTSGASSQRNCIGASSSTELM